MSKHFVVLLEFSNYFDDPTNYFQIYIYRNLDISAKSFSV